MTPAQVRTKLGITQEQFAGALGLDVRTINRWENTKLRPRGPAAVAVTAIAAALSTGTDPAVLRRTVLRGMREIVVAGLVHFTRIDMVDHALAEDVPEAKVRSR